MTGLDCARAGAWMTAAEARRIDEADALRLETHVSSCDSCRATRGRLARLGALLREAPGGELGSASLDRALSRATSAQRPAPSAPAGTRRWVAVALAAAAAAAVVWTFSPRPADPVGARDVVASAEETVRLPGARVVLESGSRVRVEGAAVLLREGRVRVAVRPGTPFEVRTDRFVASVHGTSFAVTPQSVEVWSGRVIVRSRAGDALADLSAGERWAHRPAPAPVVAAPAPMQPAAETVVPSAREEAEPRVTIAQVRRALRARRTEEARTLIAEMASRSGAGRAELELLRGDSFKLERRFEEATAAYHEVADRWPRTTAGESALFEAAQIESERMPARARRTLQQYRSRYPNGAFADEVDSLSRRVP